MSSFKKRSKLYAYLFTVLFTLSLISCEKKSEQKAEIMIKDGLIFKQGELHPFTGIIKDTVEGKMIEYEVLAGKKNGIFKTYFKNGKPEMIGTIKENLNEGKWTYYYQSGQIESEGIFKNDLPEGIWKWYHENGKLKEEGNYNKGDREGRWFMYGVDGKIKEEKVMKQNQIIEQK